MSCYYDVKQGDHLSGIANAFGFSSYKTVWDDPNNADLKKRRPNPNVLFPGDVVFIPDRKDSEFSRSTDQRHKFVVNGTPLKLSLVLEDLYEKPVAGAPCLLQLGSNVLHVTTDGSGRIKQKLQPDVRSALLTIQDPGTPFEGIDIPIAIGDLDPVEEVTGQQARLNNLGYFPGEIGKTDDAALESAVEEFQCDHSLKVDGVCGPATQAKLKQVHGC